MAEFKGLKKEDHEHLQRAVTMYNNLTGTKVDISSIPVENPERDAEEENRKAEEKLRRESEVTAELEKAQQRARQLRMNPDGEVQDENPGPGQPAMTTERAKARGKNRKGQEPDIAGGRKDAQNADGGSENALLGEDGENK